MQRKNLFKTIIIVVAIVWGLWELYPTFRLQGVKKTTDKYKADICAIVDIGRADLDAALNMGILESKVRDAMEGSDEDLLNNALELANTVIELDSSLARLEAQAIRQGLDLQGGTYLVYEVDIPQLLRDLGKNKDDRFEDVISKTKEDVDAEGTEFFSQLVDNFRERNVRLNRYFGRKGQADDDIIKELQNEAADAINRTLEKVRNRIDQFGVSEPSIQKQGTRRIVIELAGIKDVERAKRIIGTTALLEFQLLKDSDVTWKVLDDIDKVLRKKTRDLAQEPDSTSETELAEAETDSVKQGEQADEKEIDIAELFGDEPPEETEVDESDTTLLVDQQTFNEKPFTSLLRGLPINNQINVPTQNVGAVKRILQMPEVEKVIPSDAEFLWSTKTSFYQGTEYSRLYFLKKEPEVLGSMITNAEVQLGSEIAAGQPEVNFELNSEGTKKFGRVTGMNIGKQMAIVLDSRVASAPNIKDKIPSGRAKIDGMANIEEANDLALVLRAGALPTPLEVIEERTVGPSLGQDSIKKGQYSAMVGFFLVVLFMVVYYRMSGIIADIALFLNILFIMAVLAGAGFTLTLPGVAGIILTIGMAVDANVLIFERIREELRTGKTVRAAIDAGYGRAFRTILDANVTTLLTALVLFQFGTGPIRGFAVTLIIGIIASMFTAIVVTRVIFDYITTKYAIKQLSI